MPVRNGAPSPSLLGTECPARDCVMLSWDFEEIVGVKEHLGLVWCVGLPGLAMLALEGRLLHFLYGAFGVDC